MTSTTYSDDLSNIPPWDVCRKTPTPNETVANDVPLLGNTGSFQPMGCSTLKADHGERVRSRSEDLDHNFDLLLLKESPMVSTSKASPSSHKYEDVRRSLNEFATPQTTTNSYLKQYQEKYGRMGLFQEDSPQESKVLCFPFQKDIKKTPLSKSSAAHSLDQLSRSAPGSVRSSWDPSSSVHPGRLGGGGGGGGGGGSAVSSRVGPYSSLCGSDTFTHSVGRSSGRDWHCQVYNNNLFPGKSNEELDRIKVESTQDDLKPSIVLAQTALHALNSAYGRTKPDYELRSDSQSASSQESKSLTDDQAPLSLTDLTGVDFSCRGDLIPERKVENSIPVINISEDNDVSHFTPKRPNRSRASRRAVSDLGFRSNEKAIVPTPRTAALLSNPAFRRHFAKNMGVSEEDINETDFQYDFKLCLPNTSPEVAAQPAEVDVSPSSKLSALGLRERILRTSISESSLHQQSALNRSTGACHSNENSFDSQGRPMSGSTESLLSQSEARESFTSPSNTLNLGFTAQESISAPNSPAGRETSPLYSKTKFHIPSFREFRENRSKRGPRGSPSNPENSRFELITETPIEEEFEGEERETKVSEVDSQSSTSSLTIARALNFDLGASQGQGHANEGHEVNPDDCVVIYDPNDDAAGSEREKLEHEYNMQRLERASRNRNSERRSKRSHKPRSKVRGQLLSAGDAESVKQDVQDANVQDSRGKHRKEPSRRSLSESRLQEQDQIQGHHRGHDRHAASVDDNFFDGHQQVKVLKELKLRESMKGHGSDSKLMVVMVKDDSKKESPPKNKNRNTERPPRPPDPRRKKLESKKDETYIVEEQPAVAIVPRSEYQDEPFKSRSGSKRSSSRSKKDRRLRTEDETCPDNTEFDDTVISGHPGDGFAMKPRSELRRSTRRSSRRRFLPKSQAVEGSVDMDNAGSTSDIGDEPKEDDNKPSDLPVFLSNTHLDVQSDVTVTRSVSDISDKKAEEQRKRGNRERRQKLYKSDPFQVPTTPGGEEVSPQQIYYRTVKPKSSREEILNFLQDAKITSGGSTSTSAQSLESCYEEGSLERNLSVSPPSSPRLFPHFPNYSVHSPLTFHGRKCRSEDGPAGVEVERVDSGVGAELKDSTGSQEFKAGPICEDCEEELTPDLTKSCEGLSDNMADTEFLCQKCEARRVERKETIQEIADTEVSYGKDLKIIKEEFYQPMKTAGLLSPEQLETVFSNLDELITINDRFADHLLDSLELANEQGDEDYTTVHIGRLFLEASNMLLAFETYCVNQASVPTLLEKLEEEKELLRIFLQVSQTENSLLRRMNLRSFLMVPVQRVMKYPLLLNRLYKVTPAQHEDREAIKKAQNRVEDILEHINSQSRGGNNATMRIRRKISGLSVIKKTGSADDIEINKMAIELLGWNRKDVNFVMSGRIQFTQPTDHLWMKRGRTLKFIPAYALLLTLGRSTGERWTNRLLFSKPSGIQDAALVLIKEKAGKFVPLREPLRLERCVVSVDHDFDEVFEIMDSNKESFLFKGEDRKDTQMWLQHLKLQTKDLGAWRRRRNALPNIMIQTSKT